MTTYTFDTAKYGELTVRTTEVGPDEHGLTWRAELVDRPAPLGHLVAVAQHESQAMGRLMAAVGRLDEADPVHRGRARDGDGSLCCPRWETM
jgi:hypothetical protein